MGTVPHLTHSRAGALSRSSRPAFSGDFIQRAVSEQQWRPPPCQDRIPSCQVAASPSAPKTVQRTCRPAPVRHSPRVCRATTRPLVSRARRRPHPLAVAIGLHGARRHPRHRGVSHRDAAAPASSCTTIAGTFDRATEVGMTTRREPLMPLVESYFNNHLRRVRGASPHTMRAYGHALRLFFLFVAEHLRRPIHALSVDDIVVDHVLAFLDHVERARGTWSTTMSSTE